MPEPQVPGLVVVTDPASPPPGLEGAVVAIGNFDGVHRGHAVVIQHAEAMAKRLGKPCAVLTFEPHPADYFAGRPVVFRLTPERAKAMALARLGLDGMIVFTFDHRLASLAAEDFVEKILKQSLGISGAVVGYDFHFGKSRAGSPDFLRAAGARHGFEVEVVEKVLADPDGSPEAVHSAATRTALEDGDVARARRLLGHDYFVVGEVIHGQKLGRELGFPTANVALDAGSKLRYGIYAVTLTLDGVLHEGVASYGRRPTVDNGVALLEVYLLDFSGDLYGRQVEVAFVGWIRPEVKFDGLEALVAQIHDDVEKARAILAARS
ncbi:MAG: bifunctional riboflavin kinase/FAD synthetase [Beijerinckiaceae bacterium]|nr:bifunctional riboflavin kinase/FAD synthetase [Beijerinckiaceae bacterium]